MVRVNFGVPQTTTVLYSNNSKMKEKNTMKRMVAVAIFAVATFTAFVGCNPEVDRWPTYSYYLRNERNTSIQLIGICSECSNANNSDTILDTTIASQNDLFLMSGLELVPPPFDAPMFKSNRIEHCDSVFILENGQEIAKFINPYKISAIMEDSLRRIYDFDDVEVYVPFDTVEYDGDGPQPKEIYYRFLID